jgi:hypothetical protein
VRRRFSFCSAIALIASTVVVGTAGPALAASTTYSGRGIAFSGTIAGTNVGLFADTLALPSSGGHQAAAVMTGAVPNLLAGDTLHASAFGQNDRTRTEAAASGVTITSGATTVTADFAMTRAMAVDDGNTPVLSGSTTISNLVVNGTPVTVTGAANQVETLASGTLTINERTTSISGSTGSITVNAFHLDLTNGTDFIVASSSAGITADSSNCGSFRQPTTGGGWITGASLGKGTFGLSARPTATGFTGHVVYKDHGSNTRITGPVTFYQELGNGAILQGPATQNGQPAGDFTVEVQDNGEPGSTDTFSIQTQSLPPHSAGGTLQGGNIQFHKPCK